MKILPYLFQPLYLIFKNVYVEKDLQDCIDQPSLGYSMIRNTVKSQVSKIKDVIASTQL